MFETLEFHFSAKYFKGIIDKFERLYPSPKLPVWTFGNHDYPRSQFRLKDSLLKAKALACLQFTVRGVPVIYMGEEIGMQQAHIPPIEAKDPIAHKYTWLPSCVESGLKRYAHIDVNRDNARTPFQWTGDKKTAGFSTSRNLWLQIPNSNGLVARNVAAQDKYEDSLLNTYRSLLNLRRETPHLQEGSIRTLNLTTCSATCRGDMLGFVRELAGNETKYLVFINFGSNACTVSLTDESVQGHTLQIVYDTSGASRMDSEILSVPSTSGVVISSAPANLQN